VDPATFIEQMLPWARWVSRQTGVLPSVILAQWATETGWGTSVAWTEGHNPAGISPDGQIEFFATVAEGMGGYVRTMLLPAYDVVREPGTASEQARALGYSPWAASHYGRPPGAILEEIIAEHDLEQYDPEPAPPAPEPAPPAPPTEEDPMFGDLAQNKQDNFNATTHFVWNSLRTDAYAPEDQEALWYAYNTSVAQGGYAGSMAAVVAAIHDDGQAKGTLIAQQVAKLTAPPPPAAPAEAAPAADAVSATPVAEAEVAAPPPAEAPAVAEPVVAPAPVDPTPPAPIAG
jgi:Mannosyl-glycoprotein endo-beta-N-acetylglucosaminidase